MNSTKQRLRQQWKRTGDVVSEPQESFTRDELLTALATLWRLPLSCLTAVELRQLYTSNDLADVLALYADFAVVRGNLNIESVLH